MQETKLTEMEVNFKVTPTIRMYSPELLVLKQLDIKMGKDNIKKKNPVDWYNNIHEHKCKILNKL